MDNTRKILTFEDFLKCKNNFHLYFDKGFFGEYYRRAQFYKDCKKRSKKFRILQKCLSLGNDHDSPGYLSVLYRAYKIMHTWVDDDKKLFT